MSNPFIVDLTQIKAPEPIPDGLYHAQITKATAATAKDSGNPMINVQLKITEGDYEGRVVFDSLVFVQDDPTNYAWQKIRQFILATDTAAMFSEGANLEALIGEAVTIKLKTNTSTKINPATGEPYEPRPSVQQYQPYGNAPSVDGLLTGL